MLYIYSVEYFLVVNWIGLTRIQTFKNQRFVLCLSLSIVIKHPVNFIHWGYSEVCVSRMSSRRWQLFDVSVKRQVTVTASQPALPLKHR